MIPITFLLGKSVEPWIEQCLDAGFRCALVTENTDTLRDKYHDHVADWRLILLSAHRDAAFRRLINTFLENDAQSNILSSFKVAMAYIGVPTSLIICDTGDIAAEVIKFIFSQHIHGIARITFPGISASILETLHALAFNKLSRLSIPQPHKDDALPTPIPFPSSMNGLADLFRAEYFCAER